MFERLAVPHCLQSRGRKPAGINSRIVGVVSFIVFVLYVCGEFLIALAMPGIDPTSLNDIDKQTLIIDMLLTNQAMLRTLLGREAVRLATSRSMTIEEATAFLNEEFQEFKRQQADNFELVLRPTPGREMKPASGPSASAMPA